METATVNGPRFSASDLSGQRKVDLSLDDMSETVADLLRRIVPGLGLGLNDPAGRPYAYHAFHRREQRHVHATERVADVVREGDELVLQPDAQAG